MADGVERILQSGSVLNEIFQTSPSLYVIYHIALAWLERPNSRTTNPDLSQCSFGEALL